MTTLDAEPTPSEASQTFLDEETIRDAKRWRFTQEPGYFQTGPCNNYGERSGYSVGIQKTPRCSLNASVLGRGETLAAAIDAALAARGATA